MKGVLCWLGALSLLGVAGAHSDLSAADPAEGGTVADRPTVVRLTFTEPVEVRFSLFKVYPLAADAGTSEVPAGAAGENAADVQGHHGESDAPHEEGSEEAGHTTGAEAARSDHEHGDASRSADAGLRLNGLAGALVSEVLTKRDDVDERADSGVVTTDTRREVVLMLKEDLAPGYYVVMWRALSTDTHTVQGFYVFRYQPRAT